MRTVARFAAAFAAGAALMYYLDPVAGRRRRALARDRGVSAGHEAEHLVRSRSRHAIDRAQGLMARARAGLSHSPVEDGQLYGRIRTRLGRMVAHPGEVSVEVDAGHVVLRGHATGAEIDELMAALVAMREVAGIDNRMSADVPGPPH